MFNFSGILSDLQAVIAVHAARNRALTVLLVAVWGRVARMRTRLERLVALWRAGKLPTAQAPRVRAAAAARSAGAKQVFPTTRNWLSRKLGYEVVAFVEACPQAGRILRPLMRMLSGDPLPAVIAKVKRVAPEVAPVAEMVGVVVLPGSQFLGA